MVGWHHRLDGHKIEHHPRDGEAWHAAVHGVAKSWTQLSEWTTTQLLHSPSLLSSSTLLHLRHTPAWSSRNGWAQLYVMLIGWVWGPTSGLISECQALDSSWVLSDSAGQMLVEKGHAGRGCLNSLVAATLEPSSAPQGPTHSLLGRAMAPWPSCPGWACTMEACSWGTRNSLRERSREGKMSSYLFCFPRLTHCEH